MLRLLVPPCDTEGLGREHLSPVLVHDYFSVILESLKRTSNIVAWDEKLCGAIVEAELTVV